MQKLTVETTGSFQLVDMHTGKVISSEGTSEVDATPFVLERIGTGELRIVEAKTRAKGKTKAAEEAAAAAKAAEEAAAAAKAAEEAAK